MIKVTSLFPLKGWLRLNQEFYDDRFIVKMKSLTGEREDEYHYEEIGEITDAYIASESQISFGFWALALSAMLFFIFDEYRSPSPILLGATQIMFICGLLAYIFGIFKTWHIYILDKKDNVITVMKLNRHNRELVYSATDLILSKLDTIDDITVTNPFPQAKPIFEHSYFEIERLQNNVDKYYEDKLIGLQKNPFGERVYIVKYRHLSGKITHGTSRLQLWGIALTFAVLFGSILMGFYLGFNVISTKLFVYSVSPLLVLTLISIPFVFIKREVIGMYGKDGQVAYWVYVTQKDKDKFKEIVEFIQSRIPEENKEASLKEIE